MIGRSSPSRGSPCAGDLWRLSPVFWWAVSVGSLQPRILVAEGRQHRYRPRIHSNHPGLDEFCVFRERLPLRSSRGPDQSTTSGRGRGGSSHWRRSCVNFCPNGLADRIRCRFVGPADRSHSRTAFGCRRHASPRQLWGTVFAIYDVAVGITTLIAGIGAGALWVAGGAAAIFSAAALLASVAALVLFLRPAPKLVGAPS